VIPRKAAKRPKCFVISERLTAGAEPELG